MSSQVVSASQKQLIINDLIIKIVSELEQEANRKRPKRK